MTITGNNGASTRSTASSASRGMSWMYMKEEAKKAYNRGDYVGALDLYKACISSSSSSVPPPAEERQLILSNIVACRLQIGGPEQAEVAIETAKQCIAINPRYAKGHVRLASAYIAFGEATGHRNEYSNDACNALQRAVQLDRGNKQARDMLLRELRRDHRNDNNNNNNNESNRSTTATTTSHPPPSAPPQDLDDRDYHDETNRSSGTNNNNNTSNYSNRSYTDNNYSDNNNVTPSTTSSNNQQQQQQHRSQYQDQPQDEGTRYRHHNENIDIDIHTFTWQDRVQFYYQRLVTWYSGQSNDIRTILKFMLVLVLLYVAFGGRFGLSSASSLFNQQPKERKYRGNYGAGNVYDQHYGRYSASSSSSSSYSSSSYPYTSADNNNRYDSRRTGSTSSRQPDDYRYHSDRYNNDNTGSRSGRSDYYRDDYSYGNDRQYEEQRRRRRSSNSSYSSTSYHFPNLMDGSLPSMMVLAGLVYIGYRAGINPFQLLFFINIMGGRRRRPHGYHHGFGGGFRRRW